MKAVTWKPGTDTLYDPLFDHLRERHYRNQDHHLWKNYNRDHFYQECTALTISFDENDLPIFCGSILKRDCWPEKTYRILNRLWGVRPETIIIKKAHPSNGSFVKSQIDWLKENTDCELVFISRESEYWQQWTVNTYKSFDLDFYFNDREYLTCHNEDDSSCWQRIIYQGNIDLLKEWKHK